MGHRIVRELGLEDSNDTLGRWIAHRIAQLMQKADEAKNDEDREKARNQCADLILRVWSRRSGWPYGQPMERLAPILEKLATEPNPYDRRSGEPEERSWTGVLPLLDEIHKKERRVHRDAALAEYPLDESKAWLAKHGDEMSDEEADTLKYMVQMIERTHDDHFRLGDEPSPNFGALPDEERTRLVLEALNEGDAERGRLRSLAALAEVPEEADVDERATGQQEQDADADGAPASEYRGA